MGKEKAQQLVCCWIRILCSLWSNKLCLGSRIIPGCLGFCGSGFFRNCSHCRKVGVNLCLGCFSGHSLAKSRQLFQRISRCHDLVVALPAGWHTLYMNNPKQTHIRDLGFIMDHLSWPLKCFLDPVETVWSTYHRKQGSQKHSIGQYSLIKISICDPWNGVQAVSWKRRWS